MLIVEQQRRNDSVLCQVRLFVQIMSWIFGGYVDIAHAPMSNICLQKLITHPWNQAMLDRPIFYNRKHQNLYM